MHRPLPNHGKRTGMITPPNNDHIYGDPNEARDVHLVVIPNSSNDPTDYHWMVIWKVSEFNAESEKTQLRRIHLVQETGYEHLTYFGPATVSLGHKTEEASHFHLGKLTLDQRKKVEEISESVDVMPPNGNWNCQNWTTDILMKAVEQGLMNKQIVEKALAAARSAVQ